MPQSIRHHLTITGPEGVLINVDLALGPSVLGRQAGCEVLLDHPQVSRQHARIDCTADACTITDLGSSNGTLVNSELLQANEPQDLSLDARVHIGPFRIVYERVEAEVPTPPPKAPRSRRPSTPAEPPPAEPPPAEPPVADKPAIPPGLMTKSLRLMEYLPPIYHSDFMSRFLALFESVLLPIEWTVDNFDLFLSSATAPSAFLPWLSRWFGLTFDDTWSETQRRALIAEAHWLFAAQGTKKALSRILEIYTGWPPEIIDQGNDLEAHTFIVKLPLRRNQVAEDLIYNLIDAYKPAHTSYQLQFSE